MNDQLIKQLSDIVGKKHVLYTPEDLAVYGYDGTFMEGSSGFGSVAREYRTS